MKKIKKEYVPPVITVTQVEVETSICGGSPENVTATSPAASTEAQTFNNSFTAPNDFTSASNAANSDWDAPSYSTGN